MNIQGKNLKLMVVDDVDDICEFMQLYFTRRGFTVFTAGSAEDALPIIKERSPDIMLLDVNLPKMNGIDMLKLVRKFNDKVKVIMVTGYDVEFQKDPEFQKLNVFDVMRKPVTPEALDSNMERLLK
ncbi:MAG: response regulator [Candidatus Omnitrophica bacterium]|nr:response regulator [Candidatus Omnitrophota bacterium]